MELSIIPYEPPAIEFNYLAVKSELQAMLDQFGSNAVYLPEQEAEARADRARLNSLRAKINSARIEEKKAYMKPLEVFEGKMNELSGMVGAVIQNIDNQLAVFEEARKNAKQAEIASAFAEAGFPEWVRLCHISDKRWLNKTYSMAQIKADMEATRQKIANELALIAVNKYADTVTDLYRMRLIQDGYSDKLSCIASQEIARLAALDARKAAEAEERQKREEAAIAPTPEIPKAPEPPAPATAAPAPQPQSDPNQLPVYHVRLDMVMNVPQANQLHEWLEANKIPYRTL